MIDCFFIFDYQIAQSFQKQNLNIPLISSVKLTKINLNLTQTLSYFDQQNITQFLNLHHDLTAQKVLFKKMIQQVVKNINQLMINFMNVTLVCNDIKFFTQIIPKQCQKRQLDVPYVMMNFLDIKDLIRKQYDCPYKKLPQIAQFLKICTLKQAQTKSTTELLQRILRKIYKDKKIQSTSKKFIQKYKNSFIQSLKEQQAKYKYFKIIGLPFKSFPQQILQILAPQVQRNRKQICFIYEKQRFSGRGIIKVPQDYEKCIIQKNRMYIGARYVELEASTEQQFEKVKIKLENRSSERSPVYQRSRQNQRNTYNIGGRRSRSSSNSQQKRRSRQKRGSYRNQTSNAQISLHFQRDFNLNPGEYGIKVRGLPFAFSEWDVQNIFNFYNIIGGSVKLGIKPGTSLKNGQAVILMRNYNDAQKALQMNGFRCMGRYLQVKVIGKDEYMKYK